MSQSSKTPISRAAARTSIEAVEPSPRVTETSPLPTQNTATPADTHVPFSPPSSPVKALHSETASDAATEVSTASTTQSLSACAALAPPTANIEGYITAFESGDKPWFLNSSTLYSVVRDATVSAQLSAFLLEGTVSSLARLAAFINSKTSAGVPVFELERATELLQQLDGLLSDQFIILDDGCDFVRGKVGASLRGLVAAVATHVGMLKEQAAIQATKINEHTSEYRAYAKTQVVTRFEQASVVLQSLLEAVRARYPDAYGRIESLAGTSHASLEKLVSSTVRTSDEYQTAAQELIKDYYSTGAAAVQAAQSSVTERVEGARTKITETKTAVYTAVEARVTSATEYSVQLLKTAQPYVHTAVARGQPLVAQAVEVSQPYVVKAMPYVDPYLEPLVAKATTVNVALQESEFFGPYVKTAMGVAFTAFEGAKAYCLPEPATAHAVATTNAAQE